jgi:hypothetical protein
MVLEIIISHLDEAWIIISSVVTIASIIVKWTPSQKDDAILGKIVNFLSKCALNPNNKRK